MPIAGSWDGGDGVITFTPRFAAVPGTTYVVLGRADGGGADDSGSDSGGALWSELARVVAPELGLAPHTLVTSIDPGVDELPENLLRFSVTFSSRMEEGSASGRVEVLDETGSPLPGTLLEMPPELWDRDRRRLTVLVEPGRIKRGLQPHVQAGAPLRAGSTVTLVVDARIRDVDGVPLQAGARLTYRIGEAVRSRIDPALWDVSWPEDPTAPLLVRFDRPLDRATVGRHLAVTDADGHPVPGDAFLAQDAKNWSFTPAVAAAGLCLRIDTRLEDLAGNSVRRVFDRDMQSPADDGIDASEVILTPDGLLLRRTATRRAETDASASTIPSEA